MQDPRHRNRILAPGSISDYRNAYAAMLQKCLEDVDAVALEEVCERVVEAGRAGKRIYVIGNGGSAAIADHLCCDWTKGTHASGQDAIRTHSFAANVALYSAIANDYGFDKVFSTQVNFYGEPGDVLIAISSSGNSANILEAVEAAKTRGIFVIGMSGFTGGALAARCDAALYVPVDNYGIVEDVHQALMHIIAQFIAKARDESAAP